jgi:hypothetical protein
MTDLRRSRHLEINFAPDVNATVGQIINPEDVH